jgi:predicted transcriptional regulator
LVRLRRDEFEICMEILEVLSLSSEPMSITELMRKVGIKHIKAKKILKSMCDVGWINESLSESLDQRFGSLFTIDSKGSDILNVYLQKIRELFIQLGKKQ